MERLVKRLARACDEEGINVADFVLHDSLIKQYRLPRKKLTPRVVRHAERFCREWSQRLLNYNTSAKCLDDYDGEERLTHNQRKGPDMGKTQTKVRTIAKTDAVKLLVHCGLKTARRWTPEKLAAKINETVLSEDHLDLIDDVELQKLGRRILKSVSNGEVIDVKAPEKTVQPSEEALEENKEEKKTKRRRQKKTQEKGQQKKESKKPSVERDGWGNAVSTQAHVINKAIPRRGQFTATDIHDAVGPENMTLSRVRDHIGYLLKDKKYIERTPNGYQMAKGTPKV